MSKSRQFAKLLGSGNGLTGLTLMPSLAGKEGKTLQVMADGSAAWVELDALPARTGKEGKTLQVMADGSADWVAVDALPSQSGKTDTYLKTNGTIATWEEVVQITSEFHGFEIDKNNHKLLWTHTSGDFSTSNYDQWVEGQSDQIYRVNNATGKLEVTY